MARTALSKNTTYATLTTDVRNEARITTTGFPLMTDTYVYRLANLVVGRLARILVENEKPFYRETSSLSLIGDESPYYIDCSALNPYWYRPVRLVHVGSSRTSINILDPMKAEDMNKLTNTNANSIYALQLGWGFRIFFGSSVTVTKSTDTIEFTYDSQPILSTTGTDYLDIPDSLVPLVKDEVIEYLIKYQGLASGEVTQEIRNERYKQALANG